MSQENGGRRNDDYLTQVESASPPAPSRNIGFRGVHDEMAVLQNIARVFSAIALGSIEVEVYRGVSWAKFVTDSTSHRNISSDQEMRQFISSKLRRG